MVTSAKATGGGNQYVTSLRIVNPNAVAAPVDLYFFPASRRLRRQRTARRVSVTVPAASTLAIDDVIGSKFGGAAPAAGGSSRRGRRPTPLGPLADARRERAQLHGRPGTNGFAIPAENTDQLIAAGETAYVPYVSSSTSGASGYRTNLFLLSANGTGSTVVTVKLLKGDGTVLGTRDVTLAKYGQTQINNIAAAFGYSANDTNLTATVTVKSGGPVATGASVIDNAIASISYSPPMKVARANNGAYGILLNDQGFGFSGRLDILGGNGDYMTMAVVLPSCAGSLRLLLPGLRGFRRDEPTNTSYVANTDGTISFSGAQPDATFNGTIYSKFDGSVYGNVTYTRVTGSAGAPCPGTSVTYPFSGSKAFALAP